MLHSSAATEPAADDEDAYVFEPSLVKEPREPTDKPVCWLVSPLDDDIFTEVCPIHHPGIQRYVMKKGSPRSKGHTDELQWDNPLPTNLF